MLTSDRNKPRKSGKMSDHVDSGHNHSHYVMEMNEVAPTDALNWLRESRKQQHNTRHNHHVSYLDATEFDGLCSDPSLLQRVTQRPPGALLMAAREANPGAVAFDLTTDALGLDQDRADDLRAALDLLRFGARQTPSAGQEVGLQSSVVRPSTRPPTAEGTSDRETDALGAGDNDSLAGFAKGGVAARRVASLGASAKPSLFQRAKGAYRRGAASQAANSARRRRVLLKQALSAVESTKLKPTRFAWRSDILVHYAFLVTLGFSGACLAVLHDRLVEVSVYARFLVLAAIPSYWWSFAVAIVSAAFFAALSAATTFYISRPAAGSGIPEMKAIVTGVVLPGVLSWRTLVAKLLGLNFALTAGLSVGKEGPFGHICACVAHILMRSPKIFPAFYRVIGRNPPVYQDMLVTGMAAGFAGNFMVPVGGTLLSLETCTGFYLIDNWWKGLFVSVHVVLFSRIMRSLAIDQHAPLFHAADLQFSPADGSGKYFFHLFIMILMSAFIGYMGANMVRATKFLVRYRLQNLKQQHFQLVMLTAIVVTIFVYPIPFWHVGDSSTINQFFSTVDPEIWGASNFWLPIKILSWTVQKALVTLVSIVQPIPGGVFTPNFAIGAGIGRVTGELVRFMTGSFAIDPAVYAVVGSAAMVSGVTRSLCTAVIVFELTGQLELLLPTLIGVIVSTMVGRLFTRSIFDELLKLRKLPYMALNPRGARASPGRGKGGNRPEQFLAMDIMRTPVSHVLVNASLTEVLTLLMSNSYLEFPLCTPCPKSGTPMMIGIVYRANLVNSYSRLQRELAVDPRAIHPDQQGVWTFYLRVYTSSPLGCAKAGNGLSRRAMLEGLPSHGGDDSGMDTSSSGSHCKRRRDADTASESVSDDEVSPPIIDDPALISGCDAGTVIDDDRDDEEMKEFANFSPSLTEVQPLSAAALGPVMGVASAPTAPAAAAALAAEHEATFAAATFDLGSGFMPTAHDLQAAASVALPASPLPVVSPGARRYMAPVGGAAARGDSPRSHRITMVGGGAQVPAMSHRMAQLIDARNSRFRGRRIATMSLSGVAATDTTAHGADATPSSGADMRIVPTERPNQPSATLVAEVSARRKLLMKEYVASGAPAALSVPFSASMHSVSPFTPLNVVRCRVQQMLMMLGVDHMWVVMQGRLMGVVTKRDLILYLQTQQD